MSVYAEKKLRLEIRQATEMSLHYAREAQRLQGELNSLNRIKRSRSKYRSRKDVAETHSRESSESPPPAVFSDPTPT